MCSGRVEIEPQAATVVGPQPGVRELPINHLAVASVTALRSIGRGRVAVDVDGAPWRTVPLEAAHRAGLAVGLELDRSTLRTLRRELRRLEALSVALAALRHRDRSSAALAHRLERRGIAPAERRQLLETLTRAGVVDDERFAFARAEALAARGAGDLLVAHELEREGVPGELAERAVAALEPEAARARAVVAGRGAGPKTWRLLAAKGFAAETIEAVVAERDDGAIA